MRLREILTTIGTAFTAIRATFTPFFGNEAAAERRETAREGLLARFHVDCNAPRAAY